MVIPTKIDNTTTLGHVMIDLETLGNKAGCVITSIGAVEFNLSTGQTGRTFYHTIDIQSCLDAGLFIQGDTLKWWFQQSKEAQEALFVDTKTLKEVLYLFRTWIQELGIDKLEVWGNSNRFDMGILAQGYYATGSKEIPWKYSLERDVRTLVSRNPIMKEEQVRDTSVYPAHHPIGDCLHQIAYCNNIDKYLTK